MSLHPLLARVFPILPILVIATIFFVSAAYGQEWIYGIKATGSDQTSGLYDDSDIVVDGDGNMVIAGYYNNSLSFGDLAIETDDGFYPDIFLCRIGADYSVEWLKHIEAGFNNGGEIAVYIDDEGNIYLTASREGRIFVSKYDSSGSLIWDTTLGADVDGYGITVKTDMFDNVYVSGGSGWNFYIAKLSSSGDILWSKDIWVNYSDGCTITDLAIDAAGDIYFAGVFGINLPLDDITLTFTASFGHNLFWGKMDSNGNFIWAKAGTGRTTDKISLALTSSGHLFLAGGISSNNISIGGYSLPRGNCCSGSTPFIAKSDLEGNVLWAKAGTQNILYGSVPNDTHVDHTGNLYLVGNYFTTSGSTEGDFYVEKYDTEGNSLWRKEYASGDTESSKAIDIDNNGLLYLIGVNSSITFIDPFELSETRNFGVGVLDTESSTYKLTPRPVTELFPVICEGGAEYVAGSRISAATGENIQWYADLLLSDKIGDGPELNISTTKSDTLYVTQTVEGIESWPRPVIVKLVSLPNDDLIVEKNRIRAPIQEGVSYQWFYDGAPIDVETSYSIEVDASKDYDKFAVVVSEGDCQVTLNSFTVITGLEGESKSPLICYPNPTNSLVTIRPPANIAISSLTIRTVLGREIMAPIVTTQSEYRIDLADQQSGLYMVEVTGPGYRAILRVVKY